MAQPFMGALSTSGNRGRCQLRRSVLRYNALSVSLEVALNLSRNKETIGGGGGGSSRASTSIDVPSLKGFLWLCRRSQCKLQ